MKSTDLCRPALDECDVDEYCDGFGDFCPPNDFADEGTPCGDAAATIAPTPTRVTGHGACLANDEPDGTDCDDLDDCTINDECVSGVCEGQPVPDNATVEIELVSVWDEVTRCIHFVTDDCDNYVSVELPFVDHDGNPSTAVRYVGSIPIACGDWTFLCVKDEQHTLWDTTYLEDIGTTYQGLSVLHLVGGDTTTTATCTWTSKMSRSSSIGSAASRYTANAHGTCSTETPTSTTTTMSIRLTTRSFPSPGTTDRRRVPARGPAGVKAISSGPRGRGSACPNYLPTLPPRWT